MNPTLWDFSNIRQLLVNPDKFTQSDGARQVFDEWYKVAKMFAKQEIDAERMLSCTNECIHTMFISHAPELFIKRDIDYYVISSLMKGFRNVLTILDTKPKFQVLRTHPMFKQIVALIQNSLLSQLVIGTKNDRLDSIARIEYSESILAILSFGVSLAKTYPIDYPAPPFCLYASDFFMIGFNTIDNLSLRQSVLRSAKVMFSVDPIRMLKSFVTQIQDSEACDILWCEPVLSNKEAVVIIQQGIQLNVRKRGVEAVSMYFNSLNDCVSNMVLLLHDRATNMEDTILYNICCIASTITSNTMVPTKNELATIPEELIAGRTLLQTLTHYFPNNQYVLDFLFSEYVSQKFPVALITSPYLDSYNDNTLYKYFFPFLKRTIKAMSVAGVSGNEDGQDVINLLRDLAHFLLNSSTRVIDYNVGHELFLTLLLAMRRGYIETERFPEITANVISYYFISPSSLPAGYQNTTSDSSAWISEIFEDSEDRLRDMRAVTEVLGIVLGIKEVDSTINSKVNPEVSEIIIEKFLRIHHIEVLQIFRDLLLTVNLHSDDSISFNIQSKLLYSVNNWIINDSSRITSDSIVTVFLPLLRALTPLVHPTLTYLLLEVTTRVILLYNSMNGGKPDVQDNVDGHNGSVVDDSLICGILERAPKDDANTGEEMYYTSTSIIEKCIQITGVDARKSLAVFFPYYCLTDWNVEVRKIAVESIGHYPYLVYKYHNEILQCLEMRVSGSESHIQIGLADLFVAAVPALQLLAQHNINFVGKCLVYLVEGIQLSTVNDIMNEPHPSILQALRSIYSSINPQYVPLVCSSLRNYDPDILKVLLKYCPEWGANEGEEQPATQVQQLEEQPQPAEMDGWTIYWNKIKEAQLKGPAGLLESLQYVAVMRTYETNPVHQQILSNYLMSILLPSISAYYLPQLDINQQFVFSDATIHNASNVLRVIRYITTYCPQEGEYLLHLRDMATQLVACVQQLNMDPAVVAKLQQQTAELMNPAVQATYHEPQQAVLHSAPQVATAEHQLQEAPTVPVVTFMTPVQSVGVSFDHVEGYEQPSQEKQDLQQHEEPPVVQPVKIDGIFPDIDSLHSSVEHQAPQLEMLGVAMSLSRHDSKVSLNEQEVGNEMPEVATEVMQKVAEKLEKEDQVEDTQTASDEHVQEPAADEEQKATSDVKEEEVKEKEEQKVQVKTGKQTNPNPIVISLPTAPTHIPVVVQPVSYAEATPELE